MRSLLIGAGALALLVGSAHATPQDDAGAPIAAFIGAFDKGDMKTATAQFEDSVTIIDEVAPYVWTGPQGLGGWVQSLMGDDAKAGVTGESVAISAPSRIEV